MSNNNPNESVGETVSAEDGKADSKEMSNQNRDIGDRFCGRPFDILEVHDLMAGKAFICCPAWLPISVGNLTEESIDGVFNSNKARKIRESILDGSFSECDHKLCPEIQNNSLPKRNSIQNERHRKIIRENRTTGLKPTYYNLCYDDSCNLQCPSCRADKYFLKQGPDYERKTAIQEKITGDLFSSPHQRHATINITGSGDPLGSRLFRDLLFSVDGSKYPNVKIDLQTNGTLFTPLYWKKMSKIQKNICAVLVSLDAARRVTYNITRKGGNWESLMFNMKFISKLRQKKLIDWLRIDFVVQRDNYTDMIKFIELGQRFGVDQVYFSLVDDWGVWPEGVYEKKAVWKTSNPEFKNFMRIMSNPLFDLPLVNLGNVTEYRERTRT